MEDDGRYTLYVRALDPKGGEILASAEGDAKDKLEVLAAVGELSGDLREELGDDSLDREKLRISETFTAKSLEAAQAYSKAQSLQYNGRYEESVEFYREAIAEDEHFGRAYSGLALSLGSLGRDDEADATWKLALQNLGSMTERERLRNSVMNLRTNSHGYIVRTAAEGESEEKLASEMSFVNSLWADIQKKYEKAPTPSRLHQEISVSLRAVRDLLIHEVEKLVIDSKPTYDAVLSFLDTYMPSLKDHVVLYDGAEPVFDAYNLEGDISRALKRKVWLKSGGYITIEHTEALVAVDVNTGRYVGKHNLEETILKTNLEAVKEIAYQIRLRDIGGIIIIDFIDMDKKTNREKVYTALKEALLKDKSKTHVLPMSDMGLIQMTRKRTREPLTRILCEPCYYCEGEGYIVSKQTICYTIFREILRESQDMNGVRLTLRVNPQIAELLHDEENSLIAALEKAIGKQIVIYPNTTYHLEEFDIFEIHQE